MANEVTSRWLTMRWLALGGAAGAALSLSLQYTGIEGPWQTTALLFVLTALVSLVAVFFVLHVRDRQMTAMAEREKRGKHVVDQLQREIQRHHELEQQLTRAKQAAESAVLAKGEFLATMSHEIRTPLNGIVPMLDLLLHARLLPDQHELVRTAYTSSQQLLRIVDDILDYSKLEANKLDLETTNFNLRDLLEAVMQLMERPAEAKGLRLHLHLDPGVRLPVRGDPVRLRQVLTNLISNAVKFTERGSISVSVRRVGETASQHQLRFEVRDTGIGIATDAQARLFHAFTQADASTTRLYGGTGLGLAICQRIVDLMGGRIGVQSEAGHGATFHFEVPLLKVLGDMPSREADLSGQRLLLLTSDARMRSRLSMLLPNWGLRVTTVETTQEALDRLRAAATQGTPWTYGVVLADMSSMRSNTAIALHRNVVRNAGFGDVRLVYLYGDEEVPEELYSGATLLPRQAPDAELRVALAKRGRGETTDERKAASANTSSKHWQARVLLVEDNPVNLLVAQRLLSVLGLECDTATNGEAALLRMRDGHYDLVLMDCQMPVLDGYSASRKWREIEAADTTGPHLPIVAMTANAMAGDRQRCLDAGMDDYLAKPVTRGQLEHCLRRWLQDQPKPRAPSAAAFATAGLNIEAPVAQPVTAAPSPYSSAPPYAPAPSFPPASPAPMQRAPMAPPASLEPAFVSQQEPAPMSAASPPSPPASESSTGEPIIDDSALDELYAVIGADASRIVTVFLEDAPHLLAQLERAALAPDFTALREAAHSLKSSSANLGAMALSAAAKRIELGARMETLDRPAVAVAMLTDEFERARAALQMRLRKRRTAEA
ncbi:response regulator [Lysobacter sp. A6]|uniref:histidine kinase n=1 Tax=Noviluteimonas lactosilytica TaxID=2888523 RepID=A0ABS8JL96_9GAMM|nr:hybrid sensor histidine kinase/response regulator [Lysobacter lactosilyticus]MCC8364388.1 response regulator [Lysobacter lactosilyticus]